MVDFIVLFFNDFPFKSSDFPKLDIKHLIMNIIIIHYAHLLLSLKWSYNHYQISFAAGMITILIVINEKINGNKKEPIKK